MGSYLFYPAADAAQDRIWNDTLTLWGDEQAARYIRGLHAHLARLAATPSIWRRVPPQLGLAAGIDQDIFLSRYQRHLIFFRRLSGDRIGVMALVHERMDVPKRVLEQLIVASRETPGDD